jgi:hypothetical protein
MRPTLCISHASTWLEKMLASLADVFKPTSLGPRMATKLEVMQLEDASCSSDSYTDSETSSLAMDSESICGFAEGDEFHQTLPFLSLPLEVRLQIYGWVHRLHPVKQAQLAPWYPTPAYGSYFVRAVRENGPLSPSTAVDQPNTWGLPNDNTAITCSDTSSTVASNSTDSEDPPLLSPHRPLAALPTSLLLLNRQVYHEARTLPLRANEFVFTNWFASGLWAARSLLASLRPWQRDELRWVRLELLAGDLASPIFSREWTELCRDFWAHGLRGLRLKILAHGSGGDGSAAGFAGSGLGVGMGMGTGLAFLGGSAAADGLPRQGIPAPPIRGPDSGPARWVGNYGLAALRALRALEIELLVADWGDARKLAWCAELQDVVNEARAANGIYTEERLRVVCVERDPRRPQLVF